MTDLIPVESIIGKIVFMRGEKVLLDRDLADLYGVETKQLKRAVRRNIKRFPDDFMFELTKKEFDNLRYQSGTSNWGGPRYLPMAFTEQGVAMIFSPLLLAPCSMPLEMAAYGRKSKRKGGVKHKKKAGK